MAFKSENLGEGPAVDATSDTETLLVWHVPIVELILLAGVTQSGGTIDTESNTGVFS